MDFIYSLKLFFFICLILYIIKRLVRRNQNLPPSPFAFPIIGHLHLLKKPLHQCFHSLSLRYGPILFLKLGFRNVVVVSSPAIIEEVFTTNDIIFSNRAECLAGQYLGQNYTNVAWAPYGDHWRTLRKLFSLELFSSNGVLAQSTSRHRREEIHRAVKHMLGSNKWKALDLKSMFFDLTMDVTMGIVAGKPCFGDEMKAEDKRKFSEFLRMAFNPNVSMTLGDFFTILRKFGFLRLEKKLVTMQANRVRFLRALVDEGRRNNSSDQEKKTTTLRDSLFALQNREPLYYTDDIIHGLMAIIIATATETSSLTMEWTMALLLNHPKVLEKARAEIDSNVGRDRLIEDSDLKNLPYLHCIVKEALRLYPPAPVLVPRSSSKECTIGGYKIPQGTILFVNACSIHRDPKIWEEPCSFRPERFEYVQEGKEGFRFIPFGLGRRGCPGAGLAVAFVALAIGTLVQCFEWKRVGPELVDLREGTGYTMAKAKPLEAAYRPRECMITILSKI